MRIALTALTLALVLTTASGQTGLASVEFDDQTSDGTFVIVQQVTLSNGGFVVIHDDTVSDDGVGSVVGHSEYLATGTHDDVRVNITLATDPAMDNQTDDQTENTTDPGSQSGNQTITLTAMPHFDSNDNEEFDFETSNGTDDGPYTNGGTAGSDEATVTVQQTQGAQPGDDDDFDDPDTDTPGIGILLVVGLLGALAVIRRRS